MEEMVMCAICGKEVIRNMEDYVKLDAFHQGKKVGKPIFYHKDCYKDFIQDKTQTRGLMNMVGNMGGRINKLLTEQGV
jgi:hypothetical protein